MVPATCSIDDCENASHSRGWCRRHYDLWRRNGDPNKTLHQPAKICAVESCDTRQHSQGYCDAHFYLFKKFGDPLAEGRGYRWALGMDRTSNPQYEGAHKRLHKRRGKPYAHSCVDCGVKAEHWSYDGGCPNELYFVRYKSPLAYSTDLSRYSPRCIPCHSQLDAKMRRARKASRGSQG